MICVPCGLPYCKEPEKHRDAPAPRWETVPAGESDSSDWERLERLPVSGGWLYRSIWRSAPDDAAMSICFVPEQKS